MDNQPLCYGVPHWTSSPFAEKVVKIKSDIPEIGGMTFLVEDWWDMATGTPMGYKKDHPTEERYWKRTEGRIPRDNQTLYGKFETADAIGTIVHISEIEDLDYA
jgi:hypothetical protein